MKVSIKEITLNDILKYYKENKNPNNYPYMNEKKIEIIFNYLHNQNIVCYGDKYTISVNSENIQWFTQSTEENRDCMILEIINFIWNECEKLCYKFQRNKEEIKDYNKTLYKQLVTVK